MAQPELDAIHDHAAAYALERRFSDAEPLFRRVLQEDPTNSVTAKNLAIILLTQGRYEEALPHYEARLRTPDAPQPPPLPFPRWSGEDIAGKRVLIWPEQGLGDQIMMARFAPELRKRGCDVTLICRPPLARLLQSSLGVRVFAAEGEVHFPDPDIWLFEMSLMAALGVTASTIPSAPYIHPPEVAAPSFRIGVATRGNPNHSNDSHRSLPKELAAELLALPGCGSLLPEDTGARDFTETAAIIAGLDLVISVDTSIAHLAGAMGKPVWVLLPDYLTDWRWMRGRLDSPWYPSARLFRQPTSSDWASVVSEVREMLHASRIGDTGRSPD